MFNGSTFVRRCQLDSRQRPSGIKHALAVHVPFLRQSPIITMFLPFETVTNDFRKQLERTSWLMKLLLTRGSFRCCSLIWINNTGESNNTLFFSHPFFPPSDTCHITLRPFIVKRKPMNKILVKKSILYE